MSGGLISRKCNVMQCHVNVKFKVTLHEQVRYMGRLTILTVSRSHSWRDTMVNSMMTGTVSCSGGDGTAAATAQNEQTTKEHSTHE